MAALPQQKVGFGLDLDVGLKSIGLGLNILYKPETSRLIYTLGLGVYTSVQGDKLPANVVTTPPIASRKIGETVATKNYIGGQFGVIIQEQLWLTGMVDYSANEKYDNWGNSTVVFSTQDPNVNTIFYGIGLQYFYKAHGFGFMVHSGRGICFRYSVTTF
jgi:hypothetical protein